MGTGIDHLAGVQLSPLRIIAGEKGNVMHALKASEDSFAGFGEAYFSTVLPGAVKGWKRHNRMVLNLVVPVGAVRFVLAAQQPAGMAWGQVVLGPQHQYSRLTVAPGLWMAFEGLGEGLNLLMNLASIAHDPAEADTLPLDAGPIPYPAL